MNKKEREQIKKPFRLSHKRIAQLGILIGFMLCLFIYQWTKTELKYSRDAYTYANTVSISSQVSGRVIQVSVKNNQAVKENDILYKIDPTPYQQKVCYLKAKLILAQNNYQRTQDMLVEANNEKNARITDLNEINDHMQRYQTLEKTGSVAEILLINVRFQAQKLRQEVRAATARVHAVEETFSRANISSVKAELKQANWALSQTVVTAPISGQITNNYLQVGNYIAAGETAFALVDTAKWWVIARFRESVIWRMQPGDKATVSIDMYPGKTWNATITSIDWGVNRRQTSTSAATSPLPYLEPTEYWIRLAQRFPVHLLITEQRPDVPLRVGGNAKVFVHSP